MRIAVYNSFSLKWLTKCPASECGDQTQDYRDDPCSTWTEKQNT